MHLQGAVSKKQSLQQYRLSDRLADRADERRDLETQRSRRDVTWNAGRGVECYGSLRLFAAVGVSMITGRSIKC